MSTLTLTPEMLAAGRDAFRRARASLNLVAELADVSEFLDDDLDALLSGLYMAMAGVDKIHDLPAPRRRRVREAA